MLLLKLALFTQVADPISGGAGWVGAGLLGLVLGWLLLVHLPSKDKQLKDMINDKDKLFSDLSADKDRQLSEKDKQINTILDHKWAAIESLIKDHSETLKHVTTEFRNSLQDVATHCEKTEERLIAFIERRYPYPGMPPNPPEEKCQHD